MLHRRQSLRPRQLDVHSRIRLVRSEADIDVDDDQDGGALSNKVASFQELAEMVEDQPAKPKRKKNIPIPINKTVPNYEKEVSPDFHLPTSYIKLSLNFQNSSSSNAVAQPTSDKVEIDLEVEDIEWLRAHPRYGELADPRYQLSLDIFATMLDLLEKASALINPSVITLAEADEIFSKKLQLVKSPCHKVSTDIYNYWVAKRQLLKRPLLRKYWPQTPLNDTNPHLVFRPREKERYKLRKHRKNDMEGLRKLQQLRNDFDRVRSLLDMVKRREKFKRLLVDFMDETRQQQLHEILGELAPHLKLPPRQPKIPSEDDLKPKKKKKKKLLDTPPVMGSSQPALAFTDVQKIVVPSFLEAASQGDVVEPTAVSEISSYPPSTAELYSAFFHEPPVFRGRWRRGRGGRVILDRIPQYHTTHQILAPPQLTPSGHTNDAQTPHSRIYNRSTLETICNMSDSEDEIVDVHPEEDKARPTKYILAV
ncbi:unnamed protein product [Aphanomyces euteiches]|nr:hypothetical protein AeRB84_004325 [Aphanomyces euteiches]